MIGRLGRIGHGELKGKDGCWTETTFYKKKTSNLSVFIPVFHLWSHPCMSSLLMSQTGASC